MSIGRSFLTALVTLAVLASASCGEDGGGGSPSGPTPTGPRVASIAPTSGPTSGGTAVTISGSNFSAGASVSIGGTPATNVNVVSGTSITALTGQRAAGAADVIVTVGGRSATLPNGFTYVVGPAPVIQTIAARGSRPNQPDRFADLGEEITVTATVQDTDSPASTLRYTWSASAGTITGTGASVRWRAPQPFTTPGTVTLSLTVSDGGSSATGGVVVRVHDSLQEVGDMARLFLEDFSRQVLPPDQVVRNFRDGCGASGRGKQNELNDVRNQQRDFQVTSWNLGPARVTVNFGGSCTLFSDRIRTGDACALVDVDWRVTERASGDRVRTTGTDQLTAEYHDNRWWLCDSDFQGRTTPALRSGRVFIR